MPKQETTQTQTTTTNTKYKSKTNIETHNKNVNKQIKQANNKTSKNTQDTNKQ